MSQVELFHWNPRKSPVPGRVGRRLPIGHRVNNFGDLLGPEVVRGLEPNATPTSGLRVLQRRQPRVFTVGSVLHFARDGDHVWGTGWNGKIPVDRLQASNLLVHAVRGPLTRAVLQQRGMSIPEVYGDPALLLPKLYPQLNAWRKLPRNGPSWVPNLNDAATCPAGFAAVNPRDEMWGVLKTIAMSEFVAASSLHGIILADALQVPARLVLPEHEPLFKYEDYFEGTGRVLQAPAKSPRAALAMGPHEPLVWSSTELVSAFPSHLFR